MKNQSHEKVTSSSSERGRRRCDETVSRRDDDASCKTFKSESKRRKIEMVIINNDVLEEIILRLPVNALIRFQILSKHWRHTISSVYFKEKHLLYQKTKEPKIFCSEFRCEENRSILKTERLKWSYSSDTTEYLVEEGPSYHIKPKSRKRFRFSNSCDGLVCIFYENILENPILVINPAIGKSQELPLSRIQQEELNPRPPPQVLLPTPGFGKDSVTGTYKLVWLQDNSWNKISTCEVFDFKVQQWSYLTSDTPYNIYPDERPVSAKGWVYWLATNKTILDYDLHTETFRVIRHRILSEAFCHQLISIFSLHDGMWVTVLKGDLTGVQHFWRIKNALDLDWECEKMCSIDFSTLVYSGIPNDTVLLPFLTIMATSKDTRSVLISRIDSYKLVRILPHQTLYFDFPCLDMTIPYFQSLDFPL